MVPQRRHTRTLARTHERTYGQWCLLTYAGIFSALPGGNTPEVIIEGMKAARAAGAIVSFDLNYRAKLWKLQTDKGGKPEDKAASVPLEYL